MEPPRLPVLFVRARSEPTGIEVDWYQRDGWGRGRELTEAIELFASNFPDLRPAAWPDHHPHRSEFPNGPTVHGHCYVEAVLDAADDQPPRTVFASLRLINAVGGTAITRGAR